MTIRAHGTSAKIIAACLLVIAAILGTVVLTVTNSEASGQSCAQGTPSPSPSPSPTSSPTASPAAPPSPVQLCETVSPGNSQVSPGGSAPFTISISTSGSTSATVTVTLTATGGTPRFTDCPGSPPSGGTTCTMSWPSGTQTLQAAVDVPSSAGNGATATLTAKAAADNPDISVSEQAAVPVVKNPPPHQPNGGNHQTGIKQQGNQSNGQQGGAGSPSASAIAAGNGNPLAFTAGPLRKFLPLIDGGSGNVGADLPSIPPSAALPAGYHGVASGPLSRQMIGTQLLGLAALCAAIGIVMVRLWRRKPQPAAAIGTTATPAPAAGDGYRGWLRFLPKRVAWLRRLPWQRSGRETPSADDTPTD